VIFASGMKGQAKNMKTTNDRNTRRKVLRVQLDIVLSLVAQFKLKVEPKMRGKKAELHEIQKLITKRDEVQHTTHTKQK
jgi:hypothetical protein